MSPQFRILVVDDDPTARVVLTRVLESAGHCVRAVPGGQAAVELAVQFAPDVILLDLMMPGEDGLDVCSALKKLPETAGIPVLFVTGANAPDDVLRAFTAGGSDFINKPIRPLEVLARVKVHAQLRETEGELRRRNQQLENLAGELEQLNRIDPLTRLLNRRAWDQTVREEHERFEHGGRAYSVLMIDVDCFKAFNDSQGHPAGDECLRRVARAIHEACRRVDRAGRYGGEEFAVLAPETDEEAALELGERIRAAVWSLAIPHPTSWVAGRVTVSVGGASAGATSWENTLRRADEALYAAKHGGRNLVLSDTRRSAAGSKVGRPTASSSGAASSAPAAASILVVDDEPTNRVVCRRTLEQAGYRVREAEDGPGALTAIAEHAPDMVLLDAAVPGLDGLECARRLRAAPETRDLPIIMMSIRGQKPDVLAGLQAGADEYITKPLCASELVLRVRSMERVRREHEDLSRSYTARGEQLRVLRRVLDFCRNVGRSTSVDDVAEQTVTIVSEVARARRVSVMTPDRDGRQLRIQACVGMDAERHDAMRVPIGAPISGRVFEEQHPLIHNRAEPMQGGIEPGDASFFVSVPLLSTPLGAPCGAVGVLNVTEREGRRPFESHELEFIDLVAGIAGATIQRLRELAGPTEAAGTAPDGDPAGSASRRRAASQPVG